MPATNIKAYASGKGKATKGKKSKGGNKDKNNGMDMQRK